MRTRLVFCVVKTVQISEEVDCFTHHAAAMYVIREYVCEAAMCDVLNCLYVGTFVSGVTATAPRITRAVRHVSATIGKLPLIIHAVRIRAHFPC